MKRRLPRRITSDSDGLMGLTRCDIVRVVDTWDRAAVRHSKDRELAANLRQPPGMVVSDAVVPVTFRLPDTDRHAGREFLADMMTDIADSEYGIDTGGTVSRGSGRVRQAWRGGWG